MPIGAIRTSECKIRAVWWHHKPSIPFDCPLAVSLFSSYKWPAADFTIAISPRLKRSQVFKLICVAAVLVTQGLLCLLPVQVLGLISKVSVFWNALGAVTLMILLPVVAPRHQKASFVFTTFDSQAYGHFKSDGWVPLLPSQMLAHNQDIFKESTCFPTPISSRAVISASITSPHISAGIAFSWGIFLPCTASLALTQQCTCRKKPRLQIEALPKTSSYPLTLTGLMASPSSWPSSSARRSVHCPASLLLKSESGFPAFLPFPVTDCSHILSDQSSFGNPTALTGIGCLLKL